MQSLPCFLCDRKLEKKTSKNGKPYFVCDACGIQLFVRRKQGIEKLSQLIAELENQQIHSHASSAEYLQILATVNEISACKAQITKIENESFLFLSDEQAATKHALEKHVRVLISRLEVFAEQGDTKS